MPGREDEDTAIILLQSPLQGPGRQAQVLLVLQAEEGLGHQH